MEIGAIGYNYTHDAEFVMDRPCGVGCYLFLLVKTPAIFEINGERLEVSENSYVLFTPDTPCKYRAVGDTYTDDWMYFGADEDEIRLFGELGIINNTPVHLGNIEELSRIMHIMTYEHYSTEHCHEEIEQHYFRILFLSLSRAMKSKGNMNSDRLIERNYKLTQLRTRIFTMPDEVPEIDEMAAEMGMSRSGFQHLYKKTFGVSVMNDVISGRLDRAKRLLSATGLTVREISVKCGYESEYNFMRQFKNRFGRTPTEYRKML